MYKKKKIKITLTTPKEIVVAEQVKTVNKISINRMVDLPQQKKFLSLQMN